MNNPDFITFITEYGFTAMIGLIGIAFFMMYLLFKSHGKNKVAAGFIPVVKWGLLFASAGFNTFFTYNVMRAFGENVAIGLAIAMGAVNLAEAYLTRLVVAGYRHNHQFLKNLGLVFLIPLVLYSLMSAGSSYVMMQNKTTEIRNAAALRISAYDDSIKAANAQVDVAKANATGKEELARIRREGIRNASGKLTSLSHCKAGSWYARNDTNCQRYLEVKDRDYGTASVATAVANAATVSSSNKLKQADQMENSPPAIMPTLFGIAVGMLFVSLLVSWALEAAIIGTGIFEEMYINPTPLPGSVKGHDVKMDYHVEPDQTINHSPAPDQGVRHSSQSGTQSGSRSAGESGNQSAPQTASQSQSQTGVSPSRNNNLGSRPDQRPDHKKTSPRPVKKQTGPTKKTTAPKVSDQQIDDVIIAMQAHHQGEKANAEEIRKRLHCGKARVLGRLRSVDLSEQIESREQGGRTEYYFRELERGQMRRVK